MEEKKEKLVHFKTDVKLIKDIALSIGALCNECRVVFHEKYLETMVVDPAHVAMMGIKVPTESFEEYNCVDNREVGVCIDKLIGLTRAAKGSITLNQYAGEDQALYAKIINEYGTYNRKMGTIDTSGMPICKVPRLDLPAKFNIRPKGVFDFVRHAEAVSDHVAITASQERIHFFAENDTDEVEFIPGNLDKYVINKKYKSMFSLDYFYNMMVMAKTFFEAISIEMGEDNPIQMTGKGKVFVKMLLAPRIETEDTTTIKVKKKQPEQQPTKSQVDYDSLR